jgi:hypothetical protein
LNRSRSSSATPDGHPTFAEYCSNSAQSALAKETPGAGASLIEVALIRNFYQLPGGSKPA